MLTECAPAQTQIQGHLHNSLTTSISDSLLLPKQHLSHPLLYIADIMDLLLITAAMFSWPCSQQDADLSH